MGRCRGAPRVVCDVVAPPDSSAAQRTSEADDSAAGRRRTIMSAWPVSMLATAAIVARSGEGSRGRRRSELRSRGTPPKRATRRTQGRKCRGFLYTIAAISHSAAAAGAQRRPRRRLNFNSFKHSRAFFARARHPATPLRISLPSSIAEVRRALFSAPSRGLARIAGGPRAPLWAARPRRARLCAQPPTAPLAVVDTPPQPDPTLCRGLGGAARCRSS